MAKTSDPHAATVKAWLTRARNAGGGGAVQQRGDWKTLERDDVDLNILRAWVAPDWRQAGLTKKYRDPMTEEGKLLTHAFKTLPVYKGVLHRGMGLSAADVRKLKVGGTFIVRKHSSATREEGRARGYAESAAAGNSPAPPNGVLLTVENGTGRDYRKIDNSQREVILMAGTKLVITAIERVAFGDGKGHYLRVVARQE